MDIGATTGLARSIKARGRSLPRKMHRLGWQRILCNTKTGASFYKYVHPEHKDIRGKFKAFNLRQAVQVYGGLAAIDSGCMSGSPNQLKPSAFKAIKAALKKDQEVGVKE